MKPEQKMCQAIGTVYDLQQAWLNRYHFGLCAKEKAEDYWKLSRKTKFDSHAFENLIDDLDSVLLDYKQSGAPIGMLPSELQERYYQVLQQRNDAFSQNQNAFVDYVKAITPSKNKPVMGGLSVANVLDIEQKSIDDEFEEKPGCLGKARAYLAKPFITLAEKHPVAAKRLKQAITWGKVLGPGALIANAMGGNTEPDKDLEKKLENIAQKIKITENIEVKSDRGNWTTICYLPLDEGSGNRAWDSSDNNNHAKLSSNPKWSSNAKVGDYCLYFNEEGDSWDSMRIDNLTDERGWDFDNEFKLSFYCKLFEQEVEHAHICEKFGGDTMGQWYIYTTSKGRLVASFNGEVGSSMPTNYITDENWHFVELIRGRDIATLKVDGKNIQTINITGMSLHTDVDLVWSSTNWVNSTTNERLQFHGALDEIKLEMKLGSKPEPLTYNASDIRVLPPTSNIYTGWDAKQSFIDLFKRLFGLNEFINCNVVVGVKSKKPISLELILRSEDGTTKKIPLKYKNYNSGNDIYWYDQTVIISLQSPFAKYALEAIKEGSAYAGTKELLVKEPDVFIDKVIPEGNTIDIQDVELPSAFDALYDNPVTHQEISIACPADLEVKDFYGAIINNRADVFYSGKDTDPEFILLPANSLKGCKINIIGTGKGPCTLRVRDINNGSLEDSVVSQQEVESGKVYTFAPTYTNGKLRLEKESSDDLSKYVLIPIIGGGIGGGAYIIWRKKHKISKNISPSLEKPKVLENGKLVSGEPRRKKRLED